MTPSEERLNAWRSWEEIAPEVAYRLAYDLRTSLAYFDQDKVLIASDAREDEPTRVDPRKRFIRMYEAERAFVVRVREALERHRRQGHHDLVVLFDIDQTLGSRKRRDGQTATLLRPAAVPLLRQLAAEGVRTGIITTRGMSDLKENLEDALHLKGIAPYVDQTHLTAAEMELHADHTVERPSTETTPELFDEFAELLEPPLDEVGPFRAFRDARGAPLPAKDLNKLLQLAHLRRVHPGVSFVVVDDRDYAGLLRADGPRRITGVHLEEDERAHY
jgi:phosphoglycolate phosphatase-like HAD superfamily hydrolase